MLQELIQYAERKGLAGAGYSTKAVKWAIQIDRKGKCLGVSELGNPEDKRNRGRDFDYCPETPGMNSGGKSHFLVESLETVLRFGKRTDDEAVIAKHEFFVRLLRDAAHLVPEFSDFADVLEDDDQREELCKNAETLKAKASDKITLMVRGRDKPFLVNDPAWRQWWNEFRQSLVEPKAKGKGKDGEADKMLCFASGELVEPADTHPKITQLASVGASSMGALMVSFDKDAFCSYGLKKSTNAAMSEDKAAAYRAAMEGILANHSKRLAGAKLGYWYDKTVPEENDPLPFVFDPPPETEERNALAAFRKLLESIKTGDSLNAKTYANAHYYAMTVSGNGGRVVVRDWMTGPFQQLLEGVIQWFEDLAIVHRHGQGIITAQKFMAVVAASVRDLKDAPAALQTSLWRCVLNKDQPIPREAAAQTLNRVRIDLIQDEPARHARLGLLKAFCNRNEGTPNMSCKLNDHETDPAYLSGRIMAILAKIQRAAMPDVGVGVVQRYYAAASATPALVLGRLVRTAHIAHLPKIESKGLRHWFENQLTDVWSKLQTPPPRMLSMEGQTLFAMGYYHQFAQRKNAENKDANEGTETAAAEE